MLKHFNPIYNISQGIHDSKRHHTLLKGIGKISLGVGELVAYPLIVEDLAAPLMRQNSVLQRLSNSFLRRSAYRRLPLDENIEMNTLRHSFLLGRIHSLIKSAYQLPRQIYNDIETAQLEMTTIPNPSIRRLEMTDIPQYIHEQIDLNRTTARSIVARTRVLAAQGDVYVTSSVDINLQLLEPEWLLDRASQFTHQIPENPLQMPNFAPLRRFVSLYETNRNFRQFVTQFADFDEDPALLYRFMEYDQNQRIRIRNLLQRMRTRRQLRLLQQYSLRLFIYLSFILGAIKAYVDVNKKKK
jgi:hypothetical protein